MLRVQAMQSLDKSNEDLFHLLQKPKQLKMEEYLQPFPL